MRNPMARHLSLGPLLFIASAALAAEDFATRDRLWTRQIAGSADMRVTGIARDAAGDLLIAGEFSGTIDIDPGPNVISLVATGPKEVFIARHDRSGRFLWARRIGGSGLAQIAATRGIVIDGAGGLYVAGSFSGTIDFDPGVGVHEETALGTLDAFVVKLDGAGNLIWARRLGVPGGYLGVNGLAATQTGVFLAGGCNGTIVIGGVTACWSAGQSAFLIMLNAVEGSPSWIHQGPSFTGSAQSVLADDDGTIVYAGKDGNGAFLYKVTPGGASVWGRSPALTSVTGLAQDAQDALYLAGQHQWYSSPAYIGLAKYTGAGSLVWGWTSGGTGGGLAASIRLDDDGGIYLGGRFSGTVDWQSDSVFPLTSNGMTDAFAARFDDAGQPVWVQGWGGAESDEVSDIEIDAQGNLNATGTFRVTADFDPAPPVYNLTSAGVGDGFVWKFGLVGLEVDSGAATLLHFTPGEASFEIVRGSLAALRADGSYAQATCLGQFASGPAADPAVPPEGDGFYYLARGLSCCTAQGFGDSTLAPDPRDALDIAGLCP